jgi:cardiolipin synthase
MHEAIETARMFIHLETYIFADDEIGRGFAEALLRKARTGVAVRVIYDSIGSGASRPSFFERMERGGIELIEYHNINPVEGGNPLNANNRSHRKLLVVDGSVAFTGGLNLSAQREPGD